MIKTNLKILYKKLSWTRSFSLLIDAVLDLAKVVISFCNSLRNKTTAIHLSELLGGLMGGSFLKEILV